MRGFFQQCAGNAEALLLAAGDVVAALLDVGLVLVGEALDKFIGAGLLAASSISASVASGLPQRRFSAIVPLNSSFFCSTMATLLRRVSRSYLRTSTPPDGHAALGHVVQTRQQLHKAGLSRTGAANDADGLAGLDVEVNVLEGLLAILFYRQS